MTAHSNRSEHARKICAGSRQQIDDFTSIYFCKGRYVFVNKECLTHGSRIGHSSGFNNYSVEAFLAILELLEDGDEISTNSAANAPICHVKDDFIVFELQIQKFESGYQMQVQGIRALTLSFLLTKASSTPTSPNSGRILIHISLQDASKEMI